MSRNQHDDGLMVPAWVVSDPPPRHLWSRFGLRTMFVVVTVLCCLIGWQARWIHRRHAFLAENEIRQRQGNLRNRVVVTENDTVTVGWLTRGEIYRPDPTLITRAILWAFAEPRLDQIHVTTFEAKLNTTFWNTPNQSPRPYPKDIELAAQLFPEAECIAYIVYEAK